MKLSTTGAIGFSLLTAMMLVLFMISFSLFLHLRIRTQWAMAADVESQLYSLVLAENGIEYARTLLPHMDLNLLLAGMDGTFSGIHSSEWRNPMSFAEALRVDPSTWEPPHDDGLPFYDGQPLLPGGYFFLKFSNNPEESPEHDEDHIILVKSLGIVPTPAQDFFFSHLRNSVALLEARFRQERAFSLPSPLTLLGHSGSFQWEGARFSIEGKEKFAITLLSTSPSTLYPDLVGSLSGSQQQSRLNLKNAVNRDLVLQLKMNDLRNQYLSGSGTNQARIQQQLLETQQEIEKNAQNVQSARQAMDALQGDAQKEGIPGDKLTGLVGKLPQDTSIITTPDQ